VGVLVSALGAGHPVGVLPAHGHGRQRFAPAGGRGVHRRPGLADTGPRSSRASAWSVVHCRSTSEWPTWETPWWVPV
jgi:hypothetical protein